MVLEKKNKKPFAALFENSEKSEKKGNRKFSKIIENYGKITQKLDRVKRGNFRFFSIFFDKNIVP